MQLVWSLLVPPCLLLIPTILLHFILPYEQPIDVSDKNIQYSFQKDSVSMAVLYLCSQVIPGIVTLTLFCFFCKKLQVAYFSPCVVLSLVCLNSFLMNQCITNALKVSVGELRPDFLARCEPLSVNGTLFCQGDTDLVRDGRQSFPSGHSSIAFQGLTLFGLVLNEILIHGYQHHFLSGTFVVFCSWWGALQIAVSRVTDHKHHPQDVIVGGLIGIFIGTWSFLLLRKAFHVDRGKQEDYTLAAN